jgi:hypothetical protein
MDYTAQRRAALEAIAADPFQAMVEVYTEVVGENGKLQEKEQLWYANATASTNEVLKGADGTIVVLAWTHPGVQLALATDLGDYRDVRADGYRLRSVEPLAKARFDATLPRISAVYQPGGTVRPAKPAAPAKTGLKAVKLNMTRDQVLAFVSLMSGLMIVTGAPGSGKTTVAFQRIRFLFDQQDQREGGDRLVPYTPGLTRVFLANENLADQAKSLLANELDIPTFVVESVGNFVDGYLEQVWLYKQNARPRQRKLTQLEAAARTAILDLSDHHDLGRLWEAYEGQVANRLGMGTSAGWMDADGDSAPQLKALANVLARLASAAAVGRDPLKSQLTMGAIYPEASRTYAAVRERMPARCAAAI